MTILGIVLISTSILSIATSWWLFYILREKDLLIDKLIFIINDQASIKIIKTKDNNLDTQV